VKDASHVLDSADPMLKDSAVARKIIDDLMSAQHPASDLIASGILEAAGVPCPAWRLVALPDDPALGGFREEFKGAVGVFAEYPQPAKGAVPGFLGATEIIDHLALYERLESAGVEAIDARALLRARLTDIFMGDWDRLPRTTTTPRCTRRSTSRTRPSAFRLRPGGSSASAPCSSTPRTSRTVTRSSTP